MPVSELGTFQFKFKNLILAEKNASLTFKSEAGRTQVILSVDLGLLLPEASPHQPQQGRNGPARQRRRERRAAARHDAVAAEAAKSAEQVDKHVATDKIEEVIEGRNHLIAEEANTKDVATVDVLEKLKETFQLRLEMKNFKDNEKVINNFRRQGYVQGGGCVKFFRKFL